MRAWLNGMRWLCVLAWIALALSGGNYSHAKPLDGSAASHTHSSQDTYDHSHAGADCCDIEPSETLHCGASILALCQASAFKHPEHSDRFEPIPFGIGQSSDYLLEPPPPRFSA